MAPEIPVPDEESQVASRSYESRRAYDDVPRKPAWTKTVGARKFEQSAATPWMRQRSCSHGNGRLCTQLGGLPVLD